MDWRGEIPLSEASYVSTITKIIIPCLEGLSNVGNFDHRDKKHCLKYILQAWNYNIIVYDKFGQPLTSLRSAYLIWFLRVSPRLLAWNCLKMEQLQHRDNQR